MINKIKSWVKRNSIIKLEIGKQYKVNGVNMILSQYGVDYTTGLQHTSCEFIGYTKKIKYD